MITIAINENNDIYLNSSNNLMTKTDINALADILTTKSQTNLGELLYDTTKGIDFLGTIFNSPSEPAFFQSELIQQLEDTENVQSVYSFTSNTQDNVYSYTAEIISDYGNITLNG